MQGEFVPSSEARHPAFAETAPNSFGVAASPALRNNGALRLQKPDAPPSQKRRPLDLRKNGVQSAKRKNAGLEGPALLLTKVT